MRKVWLAAACVALKGMSKEQLEKIRKFYEERYGTSEAPAK